MKIIHFIVSYLRLFCLKLHRDILFSFPKFIDISLSEISMSKDSKLVFKGSAGFRRGVVLNINGGILTIGESVFINRGTHINCQKNISIGNRTIMGENVMIYDHDHNYKEIDKMRDEFLKDDIVIGQDVWIGSNVLILRGSNIGDGCVIGGEAS